MEPLSMVAQIGTICGTTIKLISSISEFIDSVQQAPKEVQSLNNELASLYASFGHIKLAIQSPRTSGIPDRWQQDFDKLMLDCEITLEQVQVLVTKAKTSETTGSAKLVWKSIKFVFKFKQVEFVRRRIVSQNGILQTLLAALAETRGSHIEQRLETIHDKVNELIETRAKIRETLVILEKEDPAASEAEYTLSDRRTNQPLSSDSKPYNPLLGQSTPQEQHEAPMFPSEHNEIPSESLQRLQDAMDAINLATQLSLGSANQKRLKALTVKVWKLRKFHSEMTIRHLTRVNCIDMRESVLLKDCQQLRFRFYMDGPEPNEKSAFGMEFLHDNDMKQSVRLPWRHVNVQMDGWKCIRLKETHSYGSHWPELPTIEYQLDFSSDESDDVDFLFAATHLYLIPNTIREIKAAASPPG